jgi:hypothetical protein
MLYLVGGASRAGKSLLANKLLAQAHVPYFSLDILMMGFARGWPAFGLNPDDAGVVRGEQLWPILRAMAVNILEEAATHPTYLLEGDVLLPKHVAELMQSYGAEVRACFLGYTDVVPLEKLRAIRRFEDDWGRGWGGTDEALCAYLASEMRFSAYLRSECETWGLRYLDCSADLVHTVDEALHHLLAP